MSMRLSRRAAQGGAGGSVDVAPSVPIAEIRVRKWTKQLKTVGHLSIPKWVPGAAAISYTSDWLLIYSVDC